VPYVPYHDPVRPFVQRWFASAEGGVPESFVETMAERNQKHREDEGCLCIMYAHLGAGSWCSGRLDPGFESAMRGLAQCNGWFAPVSEMLDHVRETQAS
jgi:hypothetical protein